MGVFSKVKWKQFPISSSAAYGTCHLKIGNIGTGNPQATILAGIHGDEAPWGALAIKKLLESIEPNQINGSFKIVPAANPLAMESDSRVSPLDNLDLNRIFPGDSNGTHTQRLASTIVEHALEGSDFIYDLHGGGSWCVNAFGFSFEGSENLVSAFNPPFILEADPKQGSATGYSMEKGAKVTAIEMGGRGLYEIDWANKISNGLQKSLSDIGILRKTNIQYQKQKSPRKVATSKTLRSNQGGVFIPKIKEEQVGTIIHKETLMGQIVDPITMNCIQEFYAPYQETAVLLLRPRISVVEGGAMIYVISQLNKEVH